MELMTLRGWWIVLAVLVLVLLAVLGSALPVRRAMKVEPIILLREG